MENSENEKLIECKQSIAAESVLWMRLATINQRISIQFVDEKLIQQCENSMKSSERDGQKESFFLNIWMK